MTGPLLVWYILTVDIYLASTLVVKHNTAFKLMRAHVTSLFHKHRIFHGGEEIRILSSSGKTNLYVSKVPRNILFYCMDERTSRSNTLLTLNFIQTHRFSRFSRRNAKLIWVCDPELFNADTGSKLRQPERSPVVWIACKIRRKWENDLY